MADFKLDPNYKDVPTRIAEFKDKHPEGCLRPVDPARPFWVETIGGATFVCYAAAAYRTADDPTPGIGLAWEPFPGRTPYTKDSELQNAETSAWGRAIVAVLASESKSIASAEDVRNRQADHDAPPPMTADEWLRANGWADGIEGEKAAKETLRLAVKAMSDGQRDAWAEWRDANGFDPTRPVPFGLMQAAAHAVEDIAKGHDPTDPTSTPPKSPQDPPSAPEPPDRTPEAASGDHRPQSDDSGEPKVLPNDAGLIEACATHVKGMRKTELVEALTARHLATSGNGDAMSMRLVQALLAEGWQPAQAALA